MHFTYSVHKMLSSSCRRLVRETVHTLETVCWLGYFTDAFKHGPIHFQNIIYLYCCESSSLLLLWQEMYKLNVTDGQKGIR